MAGIVDEAAESIQLLSRMIIRDALGQRRVHEVDLAMRK